jgi:hypothetical protein
MNTFQLEFEAAKEVHDCVHKRWLLELPRCLFLFFVLYLVNFLLEFFVLLLFLLGSSFPSLGSLLLLDFLLLLMHFKQVVKRVAFIVSVDIMLKIL